MNTGRGVGILLGVGALAVLIGTGLIGWSAFNKGDHITRSVRLSSQIPVTPQDQGLAAANNSPILAADPGDSGFLALANRRDAPDYGCGLHVSGDGGRGWLPVDPIQQLPSGVEKCYAPEVAIDDEGTVYYLFVGLTGAGNHPIGVFLTSSSDRGRTFATPHQVLGPKNFSVRMAVDSYAGHEDRLHLVWVHGASEVKLGGFGAPPNPILTASSNDGGVTFSDPVQVNDPDRLRVNAPALVVDSDHTVHVAYYDLKDDRRDYEGLEGPTWEGTWSLLTTSSVDGGRHFAPARVVESDVAPPERVMVIFTMAPPSLAVMGSRVCVAWADGRHGDPDAFLRCSQDRGGRWSPLRRLNDDPVGNGSSQYLPRLSIAPGGRVDAIFYDRRRDTANANADVSYTFSVDGGRTFSSNAALTREGMSYTQIGQQYAIPSAVGMHDFGSRMALVSGRHEMLAAWTDTHNAAPPTRAQDIFATRVILLGSASSTARAAPLAGGILIVSGLIATGISVRRRRGRPSGPTATS